MNKLQNKGKLVYGTKSFLPNNFDCFATSQIKWLSKEETEMPFIDYYNKCLKEDLKQVPAIIVRPKFEHEVPDLSQFENVKVTPVRQDIKWHQNGVTGTVLQQKSSPTTFGKFLKKSNPIELSQGIDGDEQFFSKNHYNGQYVNDLEGLAFSTDNYFDFNSPQKLGFQHEMGGISTPYFYLGNPNTGFPAHQEDNNYPSANHQLDGYPKHWYVIRASDFEKLMSHIASQLPNEYKKCNALLRHKFTTLQPAEVCKRWDIPVWRLVQKAGDYIVTAPGSPHWGYNEGRNFNRAINIKPRDSEAMNMMIKAVNCGEDCKYESKSVDIPVTEWQYKPHRCINGLCPKQFGSRSGARGHIGVCEFGKKIISIGDLPPVQCIYCDAKIKDFGAHWKKVHFDEVQEVNCRLCNFKGKPNALKKHYTYCRKCTKCGVSVKRSLSDAISHICFKISKE